MARGVLLRPGRAWLALCVLLAAGAVAGGRWPASMLEWRPGVAFDEPWRWWSAAFVHWSPRHLAANLLGVFALAAFGWASQATTRTTLAWAAAWPLTHVALLAQPTLLHYGGLSGVLHAGVAAAAWPLLRHGRGARRAIAAAVLLGLALKLLLERPWASATLAMPEWDFAVAPFAHTAGGLAGLATAVAADALRHRCTPPCP